MKLHLSENIRKLRKQHNITQEQLAESLDVTIGAVSKWERGTSVPDLEYIIRIADKFGVSVDVLLGYQLNKSTLSDMLDKITHCTDNNLLDDGILAAKKALERFPNHFSVLYRSANHYMTYAIAMSDADTAHRAIELFTRSLEMLSDNTDSSITKEEIYHSIAICHLFANDPEKAIEVLQEHNPRHIHDGDIGMFYANYLHQPDKAFPYLESSLNRTLSQLNRTMTGFASAYSAIDQYQKVLDVWNWQMSLLLDLKKEKCLVFYYHKLAVHACLHCAYASEKLGRREDTIRYIRQAYEYALLYDRAPVFTLSGAKFDEGTLSTTAIHDNLGESALAGAEAFVTQFKNSDPQFVALWESIKQENTKL